MFGSLMMLASGFVRGRRVSARHRTFFLRGGELVREHREDAAGEGDVARLER